MPIPPDSLLGLSVALRLIPASKQSYDELDYRLRSLSITSESVLSDPSSW